MREQMVNALDKILHGPDGGPRVILSLYRKAAEVEMEEQPFLVFEDCPVLGFIYDARAQFGEEFAEVLLSCAINVMQEYLVGVLQDVLTELETIGRRSEN